jgi:hypothetical protein
LKLTLRSSDPLEEALRLVGALYGVHLTVTEPADESPPQSKAPSTQPPPTRNRRAVAAAGTASERKRGRPAKTLSTAEVRAWARANGHQVSDRGRIPAGVVAAYTALV